MNRVIFMAIPVVAVVALIVWSPWQTSEVEGNDSRFVDPANLSALVDDTTETQRDAMADGEVSLAEYEDAYARAYACIREASPSTVTVEAPAWIDGQLRIQLNSTDEAAFKVASTASTRCHEQFVHEVATAFVAGTSQPMTPAEAASEVSRIAACITRESGLEVEPTDAGIAAAAGELTDRTIFPACVREAKAAAG